MKLSQVEMDLDRFMGLFKGPPGSGKSIAALSFPKPLYLFDLDGRVKSPRNFYSDAPEVLAGVEYDGYTDYVKFAKKLESFQYTNPYKTIVIDGLTTLAKLILRFLLKSKVDKSLLLPLSKEEQKGKRTIAGIPIYDIEGYLGEAQILGECMTLCKKYLKCNVIWTAHVITTETKQLGGGMTEHRSLLTGGNKIAAAIPVEFDEIYHFKTEGGIIADSANGHVLYTRDVGRDFAKTALPLPRKINITRDPNKPLSAGNGDTYQTIEKLLQKEGVKI